MGPQIPAFVVQQLPGAGVLFAACPIAGKEFRAVCGVKPGDELTISYLGDSACDLTRSERCHYLQGAYGFTCCCKLCIRRDCRAQDLPEKRTSARQRLLLRAGPRRKRCKLRSTLLNKRSRSVIPWRH